MSDADNNAKSDYWPVRIQIYKPRTSPKYSCHYLNLYLHVLSKGAIYTILFDQLSYIISLKIESSAQTILPEPLGAPIKTDSFPSHIAEYT